MSQRAELIRLKDAPSPYDEVQSYRCLFSGMCNDIGSKTIDANTLQDGNQTEETKNGINNWHTSIVVFKKYKKASKVH